MNEIIVTNESEWAEHMYRVGGRSICTEWVGGAYVQSGWAEHMYVVFACHVLFMLLCIISFRVLD
jgi:hypothetical protein